MSTAVRAGADEPVPVGEDDIALVARLYSDEIDERGRVRWGYMDEARARYLCSLDHPDRGRAWVADGAFAAVTHKALTVAEGEIVGPFPATHPAASALWDRAEGWCRERRLRATTWLCGEDDDRRAIVEARGYGRQHELTWIHLPPPTIARPYVTHRNDVEVVDALADLDRYHELYNEAFERHLGDARLAASDFTYRLADPCCGRSDFLAAVVGGEIAGLIELWADYAPGAERRTCWLTNIAIREAYRDDLEIHLTLLAEGAARMVARRATGGKGLFDATRSQLQVLYDLIGARLGEPFQQWVLDP